MPNPTAHESRKRTHSGSTCKRSAAKCGGVASRWLWGIGAAITITYMCAQAHRREGPLVAAGMLVILFLDRHGGAIKVHNLAPFVPFFTRGRHLYQLIPVEAGAICLI